MKRPEYTEYIRDYVYGGYVHPLTNNSYESDLEQYIDYLESETELWIALTEKQPPMDDDTAVLAAKFHDDGEVMWAASVWYDTEDKIWNCEFTDGSFEKTHYHNFTHWKPLKRLK